MKSATDLIVQPTAGHSIQRLARHSQSLILSRATVVAQEKLDRHRLRELGGASPAPPSAVGSLAQGTDRSRQHLGIQIRPPCRGHRTLRLDRRHNALGSGDQFSTSRPPRLHDRQKKVRKGRQAVACRRRIVGAPVERLAICRTKDRHRPTAAAGHRLDGRHIDAIQVWTLLAVHLDAHKVFVQDRRHPLVLKRLVRHHVAPVARRIANAEEYRLVLRTCPL